jgi:hypothetical protein
MQKEQFVVVFNDNSVAIRDNREISRMYDLSDCDYMDDVAGVYALNESRDLVKVRLGKLIDDRDPGTIAYGRSQLFAGSRPVGMVHWTDH